VLTEALTPNQGDDVSTITTNTGNIGNNQNNQGTTRTNDNNGHNQGRTTAQLYLMKTHKFGIRVPQTVEEATQIDLDTKSHYWRDAIQKGNEEL